MLFVWLTLLQLLLFLVLVIVLRQIIARNVIAATTHLNQLNSDFTQKLEDAKHKSAEAERYYDEMVLKAKAESEKVRVQSLRETQQAQDALVLESRKQADEIVRQANAAREQMLQEIDRTVDARSLGRACGLVEEILPERITAQMHREWLKDLWAHGLEELERLNLPDELGEVRVASAHPLEAADRAALEKKLKERFGRLPRLAESVDPGLIAGLKLTLGSIEIDGSLRFKIRETLRRAQRDA